MRYLINESTNPCFNQSLNKYALKCLKSHDDFLHWSYNKPSIIFDKVQITLETINQNFIETQLISNAFNTSDLKPRLSVFNDIHLDGYNIYTLFQTMSCHNLVDYQVLVYDTHLKLLKQAVHVPHYKYKANGKTSNRSFMINLRMILPIFMIFMNVGNPCLFSLIKELN